MAISRGVVATCSQKAPATNNDIHDHMHGKMTHGRKPTLAAIDGGQYVRKALVLGAAPSEMPAENEMCWDEHNRSHALFMTKV